MIALCFVTITLASEPRQAMSSAHSGTLPTTTNTSLAPVITDLLSATIGASEAGSTVTATAALHPYFKRYVGDLRVGVRSDPDSFTVFGAYGFHSASRDVEPARASEECSAQALLSGDAKQLRSRLEQFDAHPEWLSTPTLGLPPLTDSATERFLWHINSAAIVLGNSADEITDPDVRGEVERLLRELALAQKSLNSKRTNCLSMNLDRSVGRARTLQLTSSVTVFPLLREPPVASDTMDGTFTDPTKSLLKDYSIGLQGGFFPGPKLGIWPTASLSRRRPDAAQDTPLDTRLGGSLTVSVALTNWTLNKERFRPIVALGATAERTWCLERPCLQAIRPTFAKGTPVDHVSAITPFCDVRISQKVQFGLAVPLQWFGTSEAPAMTDPNTETDVIFRTLPLVRMSLQTWSL
ncbi:MAG: hypothetical protein AAGA48_11455 [Myxococcota bacterium]